MKTIGALKYYSHGKHSDPLTAQIEVDKLREKHPDREYTILINMRSAYKRYVVVQWKTVEVQWPEEADLNLPDVPPAPPWAYRYSQDPFQRQQSDDYEHEREKRNNIVAKAVGPLKAILTGKLNP